MIPAAPLNAAIAFLVLAADAPPAARQQDFASDPGWEGLSNRRVPSPPHQVRQDFAHRPTALAGGRPGEVGGWVQRSLRPAWYAKRIPARTLEVRLSVSGKFAVTKAEGASGALIGWFRHDSRGWRAPNSLAFRIDGNGGKYWVLFEYGTRHWRTGGGATFEGRYQTTTTKPFLADGTVHPFRLSYDPRGQGGRGEIIFEIDGRIYPATLLEGHREDGAEFDRFGIFNQQNSGSGLEVYLDDLVLDGGEEDLSRDPQWEGEGNRVEFEDRALRPFHDFGHCATAHAGGKPGEIGGIVWRDESPAYYADRVGPLTLASELVASGRICFRSAGSDSGAEFGWFNASGKRKDGGGSSPELVLGISLGGPSRAGHYFVPFYRTPAGRGSPEEGPLLYPDGAPHRWTLRYSPQGAGGRGSVTLDLDGAVQTLELGPGHKKTEAVFDRFGIFNVQAGGHHVEVYLDDLTYTEK